MLKIILDTSVCVAALLSESGASAHIIQAAVLHQIQSITTDDILEEIRGVLKRGKFKLPPTKQNAFVNLLSEISSVTIPSSKFQVKQCRDPQDDMFLSLAKQTEADYIVSLDQDLTDLKKIGVTKIVTPGNFLKEFKTDS